MHKTWIGTVSALAVLAGCGQGAETADAPASVEPAASDAPAAAPPERTATRNAYFGDVHIHTKNSFDAYVFGTRSTRDDAYRFARGETIRHAAGFDIQLGGPPLDFLAVTDHGEYLGITPAMADPDHPLSKTETAQAAFGPEATDPATTFQNIGLSFVVGEPIEDIYDGDQIDTVWAETVAAADAHNTPGEFTTFAAYEFTAMRIIDPVLGAAANLHRNVIFRDEAPARLFSTLDSTNPEDLWDWMDGERAAGRDVIAVPHNSNASNGEMFALQTYEGEALTEAYGVQRLKNEPLMEVTQLKGTSETHPMLSPNDEWAGFEQYEYFIGSQVEATVSTGDFARQALARGLAIEDETGANPYAFGLIGASDTHVAAASLVEETHWGKFAGDGTPVGRLSVLPEGVEDWADAGSGGRAVNSSQFSASGLAGVWAEANTRADIFDAMRRRETFGTSGPRMKVRFFAGDYEAGLIDSPDLLGGAYAGGVPMGGEVASDTPPAFLAWAIRDALSAPLERLQIVKTWSEDGALKEVVYDVACSGGAVPDAETHRCPDNGASVDVATCATDSGTGAGELKAFWRDPAFEAGTDAAYYVRVLENPTCRWSTWDAVRAGAAPNPALDATVQERAWSSPIWVKAGGAP